MTRRRRLRRSGGPGRARGPRSGATAAPVPTTGPVMVDLDATLVGAHSEKEGATPNFKRGFGFHPHAGLRRPRRRRHRRAAGGACCAPGGPPPTTPPTRSRCSTPRWPSCPSRSARGCWCAATPARACTAFALARHTTWGCSTRWVSTPANPSWTRWPRCPPQAWRAALDADGRPRDGAQVAELTRWLPATFTGWPPGMRIIARRERPHPGAQLRITDDDGWRITVFATNTLGGRLADLEVRHRLRARAEDRIRGLKDTGLTNLPLQAFAKNQIWLELVQLAAELLTWTQLLAWPDQPARTWEPKRLRLRLLAVAGRIITTGRRRILRLSRRWPWTDLHHQRPPTPRSAHLTPTHQHPPTKEPGEPATQRRGPLTPKHPDTTTTSPSQSVPNSLTKDRG